MAVPDHNVPLQEWKDFLREISGWRSVGGGRGYVWSGYTDRQLEGVFFTLIGLGLTRLGSHWM